MTFLWFSLPILVGWSLSSTGFFMSSNQYAGVWLAAGCLFCLAARGRETPTPLHSAAFALMAASAVFVVVFPSPYKAGAAILLGAYVLGLILQSRPRLLWIVTGALNAGLIVLAQALGALVFWHVAPRAHQLPALSSPLATVLRWLGLPAGDLGGVIHMPLDEASYTFTPAWEHLGLFPAITLAFGAIPILCLHRKRPLQSWLVLVLLLSGYCIVRYVGLMVVFPLYPQPHIFWSPLPVVLSFLPFAYLLSRWLPLSMAERSFLPARASFPPLRRWGTSAGLALAGSALLALAWGFRDGGTLKPGRVLIDEGHSDWEWTEEPYGTEIYGMRSGYNYYNFYDFLNHYWTLDRTYNALTDRTLENYDVLVIKTPTTPFTDEEAADIMEFVRKGGGLLLIGDHTNVFGCGAYLNKLAAPLGMRLEYDCGYDIETGGLNLYSRQGFGWHPATRHIPLFLFATSCTIRPSWLARSVMTCTRLSVLQADYSQPNFFPGPSPRRDMLFGLFHLASARVIGKGRVLVFTDSTVFSNFFMFIPGKPELALGMIDWLNRSNSLNWLRWAFALAGLGALVASFRALSRFHGEWSLPTLVCATLLSVSIVVPATDRLAARSYPLPKANREFRWVNFDLEHSSVFLPIRRLQRKEDKDFSAFFVWTQRLGYTPYAAFELREALHRKGVLVIVDPVVPFSPEQIAEIRRYVESGGGLLILDNATNEASTSPALLKSFGMSLGESPQESIAEGPFSLVPADSGRVVLGGTPLLTTESGRPVAAIHRVGEGRVVVCGLSAVFEAQYMGSVGTHPNDHQLAIYEVEYGLVRLAMGDTPGLEATTTPQQKSRGDAP